MAPSRCPRAVGRRRTQASREDDYGDTRCEKCGSGEFGSELLLCDACDRGFHLFCLTPILPSVPTAQWFCPSCSSNHHHRPTISRFPLVQTKIIDFFRITQRSSSNANANANVSSNNNNKKKRRRRSSSSSSIGLAKKRKRRLLAYSPSEEPATRLKQMASLATALTATGAAFSNELTYIPGMAPKSANRPSFEKGGMQLLSTQDTQALNLCKDMMTRGECPPLMVVFDPLEGFTVEADKFIKDMTIITEYVGDVDYLESRENDEGDSIMTLISAAESSKSLVICPDKRSNIARFINGINNHTPQGKKKQNLKCVRFNVDGEARVLLVANRDISKGERLYYDYNAYENQELLEIGNINGFKRYKKKALYAVILTVCWTIWKARNDKIFRGKRANLEELLGEIKAQSHLWIANRATGITKDWSKWTSFDI